MKLLLQTGANINAIDNVRGVRTITLVGVTRTRTRTRSHMHAHSHAQPIAMLEHTLLSRGAAGRVLRVLGNATKCRHTYGGLRHVVTIIAIVGRRALAVGRVLAWCGRCQITQSILRALVPPSLVCVGVWACVDVWVLLLLLLLLLLLFLQDQWSVAHFAASSGMRDVQPFCSTLPRLALCP